MIAEPRWCILLQPPTTPVYTSRIDTSSGMHYVYDGSKNGTGLNSYSHNWREISGHNGDVRHNGDDSDDRQSVSPIRHEFGGKVIGWSHLGQGRREMRSRSKGNEVKVDQGMWYQALNVKKDGRQKCFTCILFYICLNLEVELDNVHGLWEVTLDRGNLFSRFFFSIPFEKTCLYLYYLFYIVL